MKIQLSEHFTYKKLIKFTIPTIIMMIFTSIYGVVDGIFISNCVGSDAFASVNLIMPVLMILGTIGFMVGTGGSALVSKTIGEGNKEKANEYFSMLNYFLIAIGFILTIIGVIFIRPISKLLGAEGDMLEYCTTYGRVLLVALIPFLLQNSFQSFLVVAEKPQMGLMISIIAGITNMILDFLFIYVFKWGVFGAAFAKYFKGNSYLKPLTNPGESAVFLANVTFEPSCRNNWHIHHSTNGGGQILICVEGEGWYQEEGKEAQSLKPGDVVTIPANVKHWHGAKKGVWFSHIAVEVPGENTSNEWCEEVTDEEYNKL